MKLILKQDIKSLIHCFLISSFKFVYIKRIFTKQIGIEMPFKILHRHIPNKTKTALQLKIVNYKNKIKK